MKSARYPQPAGIQPQRHPAGFPGPLRISFFFKVAYGLCFIIWVLFCLWKSVRVCYYLWSVVSVGLNKHPFLDTRRQSLFIINCLIPTPVKMHSLAQNTVSGDSNGAGINQTTCAGLSGKYWDRNANYRVMVTFLLLCKDFLCWHFCVETEGIKNFVS